MNDIATISIPSDATLDQFIEFGRGLRHLVETAGFLLGDYAIVGKERFGEQFDLVLGEVGLDKKIVQKAATVAKAFPRHLRHDRLSFDHHRAVLALPKPEQLTLLKEADDHRWKPRELKDAVVRKRYEIGADFEDEDVDSYQLSQIVRAWNRATVTARRGFFELAMAVDFGIIDEDTPHE